MPQDVPADKETASGVVAQFEVLGLATRSRFSLRTRRAEIGRRRIDRGETDATLAHPLRQRLRGESDGSGPGGEGIG